jgi:hypothetical protein
MYDLLSLLVDDVYTLENQVNPPQARPTGRTGQITAPTQVSGFTATFHFRNGNNNLRLSWIANLGISVYEIRYIIGNNNGSAWDSAQTILKTSSLTADINPLSIPLVFGDHTFLIKSIDDEGVYAEEASYVVINIARILAPVITAVVIGNFILLYWTTPNSILLIDHYNIYKDGVLQGHMNGTFETIFETVGGTYSYSVEAVDFVGNVGDLSSAAIVKVADPLDYVQHDVLVSTLTGTKTNCKIENFGSQDYLLAIIDTAETFQNHFDTRSWASPQAQVTAGYPIYIEPGLTTGSYVEKFDFGTTLNNVIVTVDWNTITVSGSVTVSHTLEFSTDDITYTAPAAGPRLFSTAVRYVRLTMNFSSGDDLGLTYFYNIRCAINVQREHDGGTATANDTDVGGTTVTFNKSFKSVDSITVTPVTTTGQDRRAVYDFTYSTVNPTTFKVYLFDSTGARVDGDIAWLARGIV